MHCGANSRACARTQVKAHIGPRRALTPSTHFSCNVTRIPNPVIPALAARSAAESRDPEVPDAVLTVHMSMYKSAEKLARLPLGSRLSARCACSGRDDSVGLDTLCNTQQ